MNQLVNYNRIEKAIIYLRENYRDQPSLEKTAAHVNLSKFHFQRMFKQWAGVSPKSFAQFLTVEHAKKLLREGKSTLSTSYDAGLSGTGRLHDLFVKVESVSPGQYKRGGDDLHIFWEFNESYFGKFLTAETERGICHLSFINDTKSAMIELKRCYPNASFSQKNGKYANDVKKLFNDRCPPKEKISLLLKGTDFQIKVWEALIKIPRGQLVSYGAIAKKVGNPKANRAVGTAIGMNPIAFIIPCHRVIRESGEIGQYRWGASRKAMLIGSESAHIYENTR